MNDGARRLFTLAVVAVSVLYVLSSDARLQAWIYGAIEVTAIVLIWTTVARRHHPRAAVWRWIAAGATAWVAADLYLTVLVEVTGEEPWTSVADVGYLAGYAALLIGIVSVGGTRHDHDLDGWIDAAAVLAAGLLVMWQLVIVPTLDSPGMPAVAQWLAAVYAVLDVAIVALLLRTWLSPRLRSTALGWLLASATVVAIADAAYSVIAEAGRYAGGFAAALDVGWYATIACIALAVTHPSAARLGVVRDTTTGSAPTVRRLAITGGALLTPALLPTARAIQDHSSISLSTAAAGIALIALVVARVGRLARASAVWEGTVQAQKAYFRAMAQHSSDAVLVLSAKGEVRDTSPSIEEVSGHTRAAMLGADLSTLVHGADLDNAAAAMREVVATSGVTRTFEVRLVQSDGSYRWFEVRLTSLLDDPAVRGVVANLHDVSVRKHIEADLSHQAFHDALTGLPNRALFYNRTNHALARRDLRGDDIAVLFCDLDGFKHVNDGFGHAAGDQVLRIIADRLRRVTRGEDTVARLGGDEFAVLLAGDHAAARAPEVASRIMAAVAEPLTVDGTEFALGVSIGVAAPASASLRTADELVGDADIAMYRAKQAGTGLIEQFEPQMRDDARSRLALEAELRAGVTGGQLELHFQPVVTLTTGAIVGFEALVRWRHPTRGLVAPADFIPLAEEIGLIVPLGGWVVEEACRVASRWPAAADGSTLSIAVNASARELAVPGYAHRVRTALTKAGLAPGQLVLEITETALVEDPDGVAACLHELRALGMRIAIDDFGTGYSSLAYLQRFPIDILKIDRSFIDGVQGTDDGMPRIVRGLFELGRALGLELLAEGIEADEQIEQLVRAGCDLGQGFVFAEPVDEERALRLAESAQSAWRVTSGGPAGS